MRETAANKRCSRRDRQCGVAAVELALILPVMVLLLAMSVFWGRVFYHYTVAQKVSGSVARFMSMASVRDMSALRINETLDVAQQLLDTQLAELNPGPLGLSAFVLCDGWPCDGFKTPGMVSVRVRMPIYDPIFSALTQEITGDEGLVLTAEVTMAYVGK